MKSKIVFFLFVAVCLLLSLAVLAVPVVFAENMEFTVNANALLHHHVNESYEDVDNSCLIEQKFLNASRETGKTTFP